MLRSTKLQKMASDPEGPKVGGSQNCTPPISLDSGSLAQGPKMGVCKKHTPCVPLRGQLPIVKTYLGVDKN